MTRVLLILALVADRFLGLHHRRLQRAARQSAPRRQQADLDPHRDPPACPRRSALAHRRPGAPLHDRRAPRPRRRPGVPREDRHPQRPGRADPPSRGGARAAGRRRRRSRWTNPETAAPRERPPRARPRPARLPRGLRHPVPRHPAHRHPRRPRAAPIVPPTATTTRGASAAPSASGARARPAVQSCAGDGCRGRAAVRARRARHPSHRPQPRVAIAGARPRRRGARGTRRRCACTCGSTSGWRASPRWASAARPGCRRS